MTGLVRYPAPISAVSDLNDLTDVIISAPEEFQGLSYNGTSWVNSHIPVVSYVRNAESTTITTGTCVYLFGSTGDHATVKRADNGSDTTSSKTIGVAGADITASNNGPIVTRGYVDGIDLSTGYTAGDVLWLGENGAFTTTKPTAPDHLVFIGVVVRATNNGIIYVATQNGYELDELHDVSIVDKTSGDFLKYNGTLWVNDQINLGTDTVGSYVASLVAGTGVTLSNNSGEGATPTIGIGQPVGTSDFVSFAAVTTQGIDSPDNIAMYTSTSGTPGDGVVIVYGSVDLTGSLRFTVGSYKTTLSSNQTTDRTITIPDANGTIALNEVTFNTQTATYTLALSDSGKIVQMNVGSANILYVPTDASVNFPVGTSIDILQVGSGKTQIAAVSSGTTTINSANGFYLRAQWSAATLIKRAANTWVLVGDIATS
jgi:hypothetical protein